VGALTKPARARHKGTGFRAKATRGRRLRAFYTIPFLYAIPPEHSNASDRKRLSNGAGQRRRTTGRKQQPANEPA
jgi:hypothetical protein